MYWRIERQMKQKQRILLIGSTDYLGKTLMTQLQQTGYCVVMKTLTKIEPLFAHVALANK
jgi:hypothetical protein